MFSKDAKSSKYYQYLSPMLDSTHSGNPVEGVEIVQGNNTQHFWRHE